MPQGFCILWSADRVRDAKRSGFEGMCIPALFGGPHTSHPRLSRYHIGPGDSVYPISWRSGKIYVLCRAEIECVLPLAEFLQREHGTQTWTDAQQLQWLVPTCTDEAALLRMATPVSFSSRIPDGALEDIQFVNAEGRQRGLGASAVSIQGHYMRLTESTEALFRAVVDGTLRG